MLLTTVGSGATVQSGGGIGLDNASTKDKEEWLKIVGGGGRARSKLWYQCLKAEKWG